jgi:hypothetical protein
VRHSSAAIASYPERRREQELVMTVPSPFPLTFVCLLTLGAGLAPAQNGIDRMLDDLDGLKARFVSDKQAAKQAALRKFDDLIRQVTNGRGKAADRLAMADRLRAERKAFAAQEDFPEGSEFIDIGWKYGTTLVQKYQPLSKKFDAVMNQCIKDGNLELAKRVKADKEKFDDLHLPGRKYFAPGANYTGTRYVSGAGRLYSFRVTGLNSGVFKARAEQDLQSAGHPILDVTGSLDGIHVRCSRLAVVQGGNANAVKSFEGVVLGKTLILEILVVPPKGQANRSYAVLRRN